VESSGPSLASLRAGPGQVESDGIASLGRMQLGRYTVTEEIARGGMGAVFLAWDPSAQRQIALKQLIRGAQGEAGAERFRREAEALGALRHPNIVRVHGVETHGSDLILVQEFVEGANLAESLSQGPLPERKAAEVCRDIAGALHHAHQHGLIHRDVKPANVILRKTGEPVLIDFGLVKNLDLEQRLSQTGVAMGSPGYWSPEQATGEWRKVDARTDVYSLGATLYALLTGAPPFTGGNAAGNAILTVAEPARPPRELRAGLSKKLEAICLRCLEKKPEKRYGSARELERALQGYLTGQRSPVKHRLVAGAALILFLLGLVSAPLMISPGTSPVEPEATIGVPEPTPMLVQPPAQGSARAEGGTPSFPQWFETLPEEGKPPALPNGVFPSQQPGEYINAKDGSVLVYVPGGEFMMGHPESEGEFGSLIKIRWNDRPAHRVTLSGYFLGRYEVTWGQYRRFSKANPDYAIPESGETIDYGGQTYEAQEDLPVWCLRWEEAKAYCDWAGLRLPTEAEWEFAARGTRPEFVFPWGMRLRIGQANLHGGLDGAPGPSAVGEFEGDCSPFGAMDMCGNVSEWVSDYLGPYTTAAARDPRGPTQSTKTWAGVHGWRPLRSDEGPLRVLRGGAWRTSDGAPPKVDPYAQGAYYYQVTRRFGGFEGSSARLPLAGARVAVSVPRGNR